MSEVIVAHDRDADLIPSNVKAGVQIDDTLWTYEGELPVSAVAWYRMSSDRVYTGQDFEGSSNRRREWLATKINNNIVYSVVNWERSSNNSLWIHMYNMATNSFVVWDYFTRNISWWHMVFNSAYYNSWTIIVNYSWNWWQYNDIYTISTNTFWWPSAWYNTTWTLLTQTDSLNWVTYNLCVFATDPVESGRPFLWLKILI